MSRFSLRVLTYHRVGEPGPASPPASVISATPAAFERQMRFLARRYRAVGAEEVLDAVRGGRKLPARAVLITFDDGYRDFGEIAWPILRRYGLPATLFVPTAYPDRPELEFWWDRLHRAVASTRQRSLELDDLGRLPLATADERRAALRRLTTRIKSLPHEEAMRRVAWICDSLATPPPPSDRSVLGWAELRELARDGVTLGAHTRSHPALTRLPADAMRAEIRGSREDLEREVGAVLPIFAYPFGVHDEGVVAATRAEGFEIAVTCMDGHNRLRTVDPLRLRRTNVTRRTSPSLLRLRLLGPVSYLDQWRHRAERPGRRPASHGAGMSGPAGGPSSTTKVAYIMSRFPKLTETFVLYEILALESMGVEVEVYPLLRERQAVAHPEAQAWIRRARFHPFLSLPILRAQLHFLRHQPRTYLGLWLEVLGGTWGSANFFVGALGILPKSVRFAYEMRRQGVTHVHAHFATHPAVAALVIHRLTDIPFSFTAHGSDLHVERRMLETKVAAAAFVVAISEYNRELIVEHCGEAARHKVHVIHCGVDPDVFTPVPLAANGRPFQIVCVASFEEVKGHRYLIEACRLLRERGLGFQCHLVGDGPLRREMQARVAGLGLQEQVRLHGGRPRPEVAALLARSDVSVLASHPTPQGKREGIPVSLMEAMASGLPVVASAISGIPELVESGRTGYLVPSGDPVALADALEALARDREHARRMGRAARERTLEDFDLRANAARLLQRILAERPTAHHE